MAVPDVEVRGLIDGLGSALGIDGGTSTATSTTSSDGGLLSGLTSILNPQSSSTTVTTTSAATTSSSSSSTASTTSTSASTTSSTSLTTASTTSSSSSSSSSTTVSTSSSLSSASTSSTSADSSATITPTPSATGSDSIIVTSSSGHVITLTSVVQADTTATSLTSPKVATSFLQNKPLEGGVFALVGIVAFVLLIALGTMFLRRRSRKRLDREIADVVSFEPTTDHFDEKADGPAAPWSRYSAGSDRINGGQVGYGTGMYPTGGAYGAQQQQMAQHGYPGYGGNQAYQAYNTPVPAQNQAYPAPRSPAMAYDPARATSPPNPIAPYAAPVLPQLNFASADPQYGYSTEKALPYPAGLPAQAQANAQTQVQGNERASYPASAKRVSIATASSDTKHGQSNSVERASLTPALPYTTTTGPEQASRRPDGVAYSTVAASVDESAGYTPGNLKVANM